MTFGLRVFSLAKGLVSLRSCVRIQSCPIYSEKFLKIDKFRLHQDDFKRKFEKTKNSFQEKLVKKVTSSLDLNELNFNNNDVDDLIYFCRKERDLPLIVNATKYLLDNGRWPSKQLKGLGTNLMRLIYVLDATDTGLSLIRDKQLTMLFGPCGFPYFILMNKLLEKKNYEPIIELFEKQLPFFTIANASSNSKTARAKPTPIPYDQASVLIEALLLMNSKESFLKLRSMLDVFAEKNFPINNLLVARSFLLALQQGEPEYALKFMYEFKFKNLDDSLARNLTTIALSRMGLVEQALKIAQNLKNLRGSLDYSDETKFMGRFFPMTIESLRKAVDSSTNEVLKVEFAELERFLEADGDRYFHMDLHEYCKQELNRNK